MDHEKMESLRLEAVYPGHPVVVALCIMRAFPSLDEALAKSTHSDSPRALTSDAVPGAGSNVWGALDLLREIQNQGWSPDQAFDRARERWIRDTGPGTGNHENMHGPGQEQAEAWREAFIEKLSTWLPIPSRRSSPRVR